MAAIAKSDANEIAKEYYAAGGMHVAAYKENPALAVCKKVKVKGKHYDFPVKYGLGSNRSRTAATALAKANKKNWVEFNVTTVPTYTAKDIETVALTEITDEGAFVDLLTDTIDEVGLDLGNGNGEDLFLHRGAALGQVGSVSGTSLTLKNPSHVTRFWVGQVLASSEADGLSGALQAGTAQITAINRDTGVLTTTVSDWTTQIATLDADDFLFNAGDFGVGRAGLADWVPDVTTGLGTAFYGATRSVDATRLAGSRQAVNAGTDIMTAVRALVSRIGREEGKPDTLLMSYDTLADWETQLDSKTYIDIPAKGVELGFQAITVTVAGRKLSLLPDRSCGDDRIYAIKKDALELVHSQDSPYQLEDLDGDVLSRNASAFSYDIRGLSIVNFAVREPNNFGVVVFS